jgi:B12-binding domain/radical SAM domain protein of rhizo-twelve system
MKIALINPNWSFEGSIYFGCREPHLPLEYGYAKQLLEREGHQVLLVDGQMERLPIDEIALQLSLFRPDFTVTTTAPSYLFWRCAPPELRVPRNLLNRVKSTAGTTIVIGPHISTTPRAALLKLNADAGVLGEPEEILPKLVETPRSRWNELSSICYRWGDEVLVQGSPHQSDMSKLPILTWPRVVVQKHHHHHHRFDTAPDGPGAEMEVSRGCPYHCTFCAKENFRTDYRKRPLSKLLEEMDSLIACGAVYFYFIDEIFLPDKELLMGVAERNIKFGIQTRIDLWKPEMLDLLGGAGCVSIEAGIESISEEGRELLDKKCRMSTDDLAERLIYAKERVPFVQANLIECNVDDSNAIESWREKLLKNGVWANKPVPLFPYPGSPDYTRMWGAPDDLAWERAHEYYLYLYSKFSDVQEERPLPLAELESTA